MIHGFRFANIIPSPKARIKMPVMMEFRGLTLAVTEETTSWKRMMKNDARLEMVTVVMVPGSSHSVTDILSRLTQVSRNTGNE